MTDSREAPDFRAPGWVRRIEHGDGIATLHYDEDRLSTRVAVEHLCTRQRDGQTLLIAPFLTTGPNGHRIVQPDPLTITASILCLDCGLHGFITDGAWRSV